ncbi:MAG: BrnT family toxin [Erysipelotrichaceae bacterium]|nr:BrnT family toxin [Erysipelotrichaceae bacterium]
MIDEIIVEWDDNKNKINIQKRGISFETAALVFC